MPGVDGVEPVDIGVVVSGGLPLNGLSSPEQATMPSDKASNISVFLFMRSITWWRSLGVDYVGLD